jgi:hypothetical protein
MWRAAAQAVTVTAGRADLPDEAKSHECFHRSRGSPVYSPVRRRAQRNFSQTIQADLGLQKIFRFRRRANHLYDFAPSRLDKRGASRWSRTLSAGCDGRGGALRRSASMRTAKPCGPDVPTLALRSRKYPRTTVARKPGHRGEHEVDRKPLRREGRIVRHTCGDFARVVFPSHARLRVRRAPGFPCALCLSGTMCWQDSGESRRENAGACLGSLKFESDHSAPRSQPSSRRVIQYSRAVA